MSSKDKIETIYTTPHSPDIGSAVEVLAFMLVPEAAFVTRSDDADARAAIHDVLHEAKRDALLEWYRRFQKRP